MKIKLLHLSALIFLLAHLASAQTPGFYFSGITCTIFNKNDSSTLIDSEFKVLKEAKNGQITLYDNPAFDLQFKSRLSKAAVDYSFKDSLSSKNGTRDYRMVLMENRNADTCFIMSFNPYLTYNYQAEGPWVLDPDTSIKIKTGIVMISRHRLPGSWVKGKGIRFWIPLCEYSEALSKKDLSALKFIHQHQLATVMNGTLSGDTIYRTVRFTCDSNQYLPQAPYHNLLRTLENGMFGGELHAYKDNLLSTIMSKREIESTIVGWDSTNQVADPYNPGVFIIAPLKVEGQVKSLLIYEKWMPFTSQNISNGYDNWPPKPSTGYGRRVCAYGLHLTNGNTIWFSPEEVNKVLLKSNFNMIPYEECFRAERFKTLQIQVHTW